MTDNVQDEIKNIVDQNDVVLFMKGTKDQPQCGFSNAVVNTLSFSIFSLAESLEVVSFDAS